MYRKHACKIFLKSKYNRTKHQKPAFCTWNCQLIIHLMFKKLLNGTSMFVDHENLGIDILISEMCWIFKKIWQKYYFPVMASTKWPPYLKSLAMTKGIILPNFMLVPQNARFFTYRLDYLIHTPKIQLPPPKGKAVTPHTLSMFII